MARSSSLKRKNLLIDQEKLARAQSLLNARTETEAVDRALDEVLFGQEVMDGLLHAAGRGKTVADVFRNLR